MTAPRLPERWSHSTIDLCLSCPAAAQAKWSGEPSVVSDNVRVGGELHEAIERYAVACWEHGVAKDKEAAARIADGYCAEVRTSLLSFAEDTRWPWRKLQAANEEACPVEQMWECTLPNGAKFVGRIDLCVIDRNARDRNPFLDSQDRVVIADWKKGRPAAWESAEVPKQLLRYAVMYRRNNPEQHDFALMYGAPGWSGEWALKEWTVGKQEVDRAERELCATIDRLCAMEEWAAQPGAETCPRCFYVNACPLRGTDTFAELTGEFPEALAQAASWHDAQAAAAKALLKTHAEEAGGAAAGWGWKTKTSLRPVMDRAALAEWLTTQGHDVTELLGDFGKGKVQKAIKGGWLPEDAFEEVPAGRSFGPLAETETTAPEGAQGGE